MGPEDAVAQWEYNRKWAIWHLLSEIWALQTLLASAVAEDEDERTRSKNESPDPVLPHAIAAVLQADHRLRLTSKQRHLLVQMRLLSELIMSPSVPGPPFTGSAATTADTNSPHVPASAPRVPNLDLEGLAAPPSVLDGLLTLATGVVEVMTGFHIAGGIAAMLHGAFRIAAPDSPLTQMAATCRKALSPGLTVIQESVKMMAPLPDNEHSGLRDALCFAAYQITGGTAGGVEVGAFKHQLFNARSATHSGSHRLGTHGARRVTRSAPGAGLPPISTTAHQPVDEPESPSVQKDSPNEVTSAERLAEFKRELARRKIDPPEPPTRGIGL